jgi:hypothetical protein
MVANYVYVVRDAIGLTGTEKCVAMILVAHRNHKTGQCNLSYETIATKAGFKRNAVIRAIAALVAKRLITKKSRKTTAGDQTSNQYDFHPETWLAMGEPNEQRGIPEIPPRIPEIPPSIPDAVRGIPKIPPGYSKDTQSSSLSCFEDKKEEKDVFLGVQKQEVQKPTPEMISDASSKHNWPLHFVADMGVSYTMAFRDGSFAGSFDDYVAMKLSGRKNQKMALQGGKARHIAPRPTGGMRSFADIAEAMNQPGKDVAL